jgi:hypothetical protein
MGDYLRALESMSFGENDSENRESRSMKHERAVLTVLHFRAVTLLSACLDRVPTRLQAEIKQSAAPCDPDQVVVEHSRALELLSRCSPYLYENRRNEIACLADDTGKTTLIPVRVERVDGMVLIDPYNMQG